MSDRLTLDDVLEAYKAHSYKCCVINDKKITGHTFESPKNYKIAYVPPGIKTAAGKIIYKPVIEVGDQIIYYVCADLPFGSVHDRNDPEVKKKIENFEIKLEKPYLKFTRFSRERIMKSVRKEEGESDEDFNHRIDHLDLQNQKMCEVMRIISVGFQKITEEVSQIDPKKFGCYFRNYGYATKLGNKPWVPPSIILGECSVPLLELKKDEKTGELIPRDTPVFRIRFDQDKDNYGPLVRARWIDRKKTFEPFIKDINKYLDGEADDLLRSPTGKELNIVNMKDIITARSLMRGSFVIENLISIISQNGASLHCYVQSMYVNPNLNVKDSDDPDEGIMGARPSRKENVERMDHVNEAINSINFGEEFD